MQGIAKTEKHLERILWNQCRLDHLEHRKHQNIQLYSIDFHSLGCLHLIVYIHCQKCSGIELDFPSMLFLVLIYPLLAIFETMSRGRGMTTTSVLLLVMSLMV